MDNLLVIFVVLLIVIAIETLALFFIAFKTPAITFLKAAMTKLPLMYIIGKDGLGHFRTFKSVGNTAKVGKDGLYNLTENSHTLEMSSKLPLFIAFRDLAATMVPEYPAIIQELREQGVVINNVEDINLYIHKIKQGVNEDLPINVKSYKTYKFHDLENMFPNNLDPTFIDATVQSEVAKHLKMVKNGPMMLGGVVILMIVAALAVYILRMSFGDTISSQDCAAMVNAAKCAFDTSIAAVQTVNTTPLI